MSLHKLSLSAARTLALHTQRLGHAVDLPPTSDKIIALVEQLGCVQIDTLQMVHRSQYLLLWSRLGTYDPADFDDLIYTSEKRHFYEYWQHAACIIPLKYYRYSLPQMQLFRDGGGQRGKYHQKWLANPDNMVILEAVRERIRQEGGLRTADFEHAGTPRGTWWDWKPAKRALELLFDQGELFISERVKFQRVYDLAERVIPAWVDQSTPTVTETQRFYLEQAVRALGVCQVLQAADYSYMGRTTARPLLREMVAEGVFLPVQVEISDGSEAEFIIHRDNLALAEQAADGALTAERTTFLTPFDSLFWARDRDRQLWSFRQTLEAYKPQPQREWGYFCLPILYKDRLIGRFDPKLERKSGTLRMKALHLEPGVVPDEAMIHALAQATRDFLKFHKAQNLIIEKSPSPEFSSKLLQAL